MSLQESLEKGAPVNKEGKVNIQLETRQLTPLFRKPELFAKGKRALHWLISITRTRSLICGVSKHRTVDF